MKTKIDRTAELRLCIAANDRALAHYGRCSGLIPARQCRARIAAAQVELDSLPATGQDLAVRS